MNIAQMIQEGEPAVAAAVAVLVDPAIQPDALHLAAVDLARQQADEIKRLRAELAALRQEQEPVSDEEIREVFLVNGFTIKPGNTDLKPYVFSAARALLALRPAQVPLTDEQIVSRAMEAGDLAELCILRDFYPELGAVLEHWVPREHVRRLVRTIERAHGIGQPAQEGGAA